MRKVLVLILLLLELLGCTNLSNEKQRESKPLSNSINATIERDLSEKIAEVYSQEGVEYKDDRVYFIQGLEYDYDPATNIRYRGLLYSKRLQEMGAVKTLEIGLRDNEMNGAELYNYAKQYSAMFKSIEIESFVEKKAKEIFGEKTTLYNDWSMTEKKYNNLMKNRGKANLGWESKNAAQKTIVNVYGEDLEKLNIDEYKQKTFELSKFIYEFMNYSTSLQIYVRDKSYFKNYELVYCSIEEPFRELENIKEILNKIKNKKQLSEEEEKTLLSRFIKGITREEIGIFSQGDFKNIVCWFTDETNIPISILKNIDYYGELRNGKITYYFKEDREKRGIK